MRNFAQDSYSVKLMRCFDAAKVNALVNHPEIRPYVGGDISAPLDLSPAFIDRNVFLLGDHGGFALTWCAPKTYEVHTFILPEGRGKWAIDATRAGFEIMQRDHGAVCIWTRVKPQARAVRLFTRAAGFHPSGADDFDIGWGLEPYEIYEWRA